MSWIFGLRVSDIASPDAIDQSDNWRFWILDNDWPRAVLQAQRVCQAYAPDGETINLPADITADSAITDIVGQCDYVQVTQFVLVSQSDAHAAS
jgi:hypothetical protein